MDWRRGVRDVAEEDTSSALCLVPSDLVVLLDCWVPAVTSYPAAVSLGSPFVVVYDAVLQYLINDN